MTVSIEEVRRATQDLTQKMTVWTGKHGHSAYANGKCYCEVCTAANTKRMNLARSRRRKIMQEQGIPASVKHGRSAYVNWGCRCDVCKAGNKTSK